MPEFILDTGGRVYVEGLRQESKGSQFSTVLWDDLDSFTQGYIEALFFTEYEPSTTRENHNEEDEREGRISSLPGDYGFSDLSPDALRSIIRDCAKFQTDNRADLDEALDQGRIDGYDETSAGRDFWYTRNGHGVGFWSREELTGGMGDKLSAACRTWCNVDAYREDAEPRRVFLS